MLKQGGLQPSKSGYVEVVDMGGARLYWEEYGAASGRPLFAILGATTKVGAGQPAGRLGTTGGDPRATGVAGGHAGGHWLHVRMGAQLCNTGNTMRAGVAPARSRCCVG